MSYKDTHANRLIDPTGRATGTFMDARFASTGGMSGSGALVPHSEAASLTRTDTAREWSIIARYPQGTCHGW